MEQLFIIVTNVASLLYLPVNDPVELIGIVIRICSAGQNWTPGFCGGGGRVRTQNVFLVGVDRFLVTVDLEVLSEMMEKVYMTNSQQKSKYTFNYT